MEDKKQFLVEVVAPNVHTKDGKKLAGDQYRCDAQELDAIGWAVDVLEESEGPSQTGTEDAGGDSEPKTGDDSATGELPPDGDSEAAEETEEPPAPAAKSRSRARRRAT